MRCSPMLVGALVLTSLFAAIACGSSSTSESPADAGRASDATTAESGAASDAGANDSGCVGVRVDDAGVTHGCAAGGQGPGDRDDGGGATAPPSDASADASNLPFGASCLNNAQCDSGICFDYT